jgi:hypothetical protein
VARSATTQYRKNRGDGSQIFCNFNPIPLRVDPFWLSIKKQPRNCGAVHAPCGLID